MKGLKVFKFGGASVKNAAGIQNVAEIIKSYGQSGPLIVVVSATGKTTNKLEEIVKAYFDNNKELASQKRQEILQSHIEIATQLFGDGHPVVANMQDFLAEIDWVLEEQRQAPFNYTYDQIVSIGEFISSKLLEAQLQHIGLPVTWVDARDLIRTDDTYREGRIQWKESNAQILETLHPILSAGKIVLTQGFIGSTSENTTTTLGREGSDYTAAILSSAMDADGMYIWKDVPGILTADPAEFDNATKLDRLSYTEAIEMTYYGAKVIHPKTIQPLQNKSIPLYVKSFIQPDGEGSIISAGPEMEYPPIVVVEHNQAMIHFGTNDFSFVAEHHLSQLFTLFDKYRIKVNMMRNTAISFSVCVTNDPQRVEPFIKEASDLFNILVDPDLDLITVRHPLENTLQHLLTEKIVILEERIKRTIQLVVKHAPAIIPKHKS